MKTLRTAALTVVTLIPLAELLFLPLYLAHRTNSELNQFTGSYMACNAADSECPLAEALGAEIRGAEIVGAEPWR